MVNTKIFHIFFSSASQLIFILHRLLTKIFPPSPNIQRSQNIFFETLGLSGLLLYLTNINLNSDLFSSGEIIIFLAFVLSWKSWKVLYTHPLFLLACIWVIAVIISALTGIHYFPVAPALDQLDEARKMLLYSLFIVVGWWIGPNIISIRNAFLVVCLGFVLSSLPWLIDWSSLSHMIEGNRPGKNILGMYTNQYANWAGFLLVGLTFFGINILPKFLTGSKQIYLGYLLYIFIITCLTVGVYVTQTRTIWIGVIASIIFGTILLFFTCIKAKNSFHGLVVPIIIILTIIGLGVVKFEHISARFAQESTTISTVVSGTPEEVELTPLGKRIHVYQWALSYDSFISLFGWGPLATVTISENQNLREIHDWPEKLEMVHLHNTALEICFRTGIFGTATIILIFLFLIKGVLDSFRKDRIPPFLFTFLVSTMFFFVFAGLTTFNIRIIALFPILGGLLFSSSLMTLSSSGKNTNFRS